jgi:S1-C subfamily serine protease
MPEAAALSAALAGLVRRFAPAIVTVAAGRAAASGFHWRDGLVVTAEEALPEEGPFTVTLPGGATAEAALRGRDPSTDVALLALPGVALPATELEPAAAAAGQLVLAIGAEEGAPLAALGIVARAGGPWRSMRGGEIDARIDLDLALRSRAQGGLAVTADGAVLGMAVHGPRRRPLVIPAATVARAAALLAAQGRIPRGWLGLSLQPVRLDGGGGSGAMVVSVEPGGPGATAGLVQGDILTGWDGTPLADLRAVLAALGPGSVGREVALALRRAGARRDVRLVIGERPEA